jgi:hypothetical protein
VVPLEILKIHRASKHVFFSLLLSSSLKIAMLTLHILCRPCCCAVNFKPRSASIMEIGVWLGLKETMTLRYVLRRWTS